MNNEITLTLTASDVTRILIATTTLQYGFMREADEAKSEDLRYDKERAAAMWKRIHDEIRAQRNAQQNED